MNGIAAFPNSVFYRIFFCSRVLVICNQSFLTDTLILLSSRRAAEREIKSYIQQRQDAAILITIDVDDFKQINDKYGHDCGDEVLLLIGQSITACFRSSDILARMGGDEFFIFMQYAADAHIAETHMKKLQDEISRRVRRAGYSFKVNICSGIACYPSDADNFENLYHCSDLALYQSKKNGKKQCTSYISSDENNL